MIINNNTAATIVLLLVSDDNGIDGMEGLAGSITVKMSKNGSSLSPVTVTLTELGDGWYTFSLSESHTDTIGPLIITARAEGTLEWRDIHQVVVDEETTLNKAVLNQIADHVLRRSFAAAWDSDNGDESDFRSLLGSVAKDVNRVELVGTSLKIYDGTDEAVIGEQTVVTNHNAAPIVGIDTEDGAIGEDG